MNLETKLNFVIAYSATLTVACITIGVIAVRAPNKLALDELTVGRINIAEKNGTLRFVLSNKAKFPGVYVHGQERPKTADRSTAGIVFLNDEGTENGGLIWGGSKSGSRDGSGRVESHGYLSFDQYDGSEVFALAAFEENGVRASRMMFRDWRDREGEKAQVRMRLGKFKNRDVGIEVKDPQGRTRIAIQTDSAGVPSLRFFDEKGRTVAQLPSRGDAPNEFPKPGQN